MLPCGFYAQLPTQRGHFGNMFHQLVDSIKFETRGKIEGVIIRPCTLLLLWWRWWWWWWYTLTNKWRWRRWGMSVSQKHTQTIQMWTNKTFKIIIFMIFYYINCCLFACDLHQRNSDVGQIKMTLSVHS